MTKHEYDALIKTFTVLGQGVAACMMEFQLDARHRDDAKLKTFLDQIGAQLQMLREMRDGKHSQ